MLGPVFYEDLAVILSCPHHGVSITVKSDVGVCNKGSLERL